MKSNEPEVHRLLDQLQEEIAVNVKLSKALADRLSSVLRPEVSKDSELSRIEDSYCELGGRLVDALTDAQRVKGILETIYERLEV